MKTCWPCARNCAFLSGDDRDLLFSADYSREDTGSQTRSVTRWDRFPPSASSGRPRVSEHGLPIGYDATQWGLSARLKQLIGGGELTAIAAYRDVSSVTLDQFGGRSLAVGQGFDDLFGQEEDAEQLSLEVRYAFDPALNWRAVAGLYYIREDVDRARVRGNRGKPGRRAERQPRRLAGRFRHYRLGGLSPTRHGRPIRC